MTRANWRHTNRVKRGAKMGTKTSLRHQPRIDVGVYQSTTSPEDAQLIFAKNTAA